MIAARHAVATVVLGVLAAALAAAAASPRTHADEAASCPALVAQYAAAIDAARSCTPGDADACGAVRLRALDDPCRCEVAVSPAAVAAVDAVAARHRKAVCPAPAGLCTRRCRAPVPRCEAGGSGGRCG